MALKERIALGILLFLLAISFGCASSSSSGGGTIENSAAFTYWGWLSMTGIALLIVILLLSLGYMASVFLADEKMKAWVKKEVGQAVVSAIIVAIVISSLYIFDSGLRTVIAEAGQDQGQDKLHVPWENYIYSGVCCDPSTTMCIKVMRHGMPCQSLVAIDYLQMIYESLEKTSDVYYAKHFQNAFIAGLSGGFSILGYDFLPTFSVNPFAFMTMNADFYSILFDLAIKNMMLVKAQQIFFEYFGMVVFPLMLSMGLVLRIFYFTRKLGGLLIALSLAFYYVFPLAYTLCDAILFGMMGGWTQANRNTLGLTYDGSGSGGAIPFLDVAFTMPDAKKEDPLFSQSIAYDICGTASPADSSAQEGYLSSFRNNWNSLSGMGWFSKSFGNYGTIVGNGFAPDGPIGSLSSLFMFTLIAPFLGLMVSLAFFKVLSPLIGGDVEISLLSRLI